MANEQRKLVYEERRNLMRVDDVSENLEAMREDVVDTITDQSIPPQSLEEQWNLDQLQSDLEKEFGLRLSIKQWLEEDKTLHEKTLRARLQDEVQGAYDTKCRELGEPLMRHLEKSGHSPGSRYTMEGAPGIHGLPEAGHRAAGLCTKKPETGI